MNCLFYACQTPWVEHPEAALGPNRSVFFWRTRWNKIVPRGLPLYPFGVWWLLHHFRVFANRDYGLLLIYENETLIHRSCVFPRYFRFPFMEKTDLQIGDTWTSPEYRGQGLASLAIRRIVEMHPEPRRFWYVVEEASRGSIRAAERAGLTLTGRGRRTTRLGSQLFGQFVMDTAISCSAESVSVRSAMRTPSG